MGYVNDEADEYFNKWADACNELTAATADNDVLVAALVEIADRCPDETVAGRIARRAITARRAAVVETPADPCETCGGSKRVPGMVMLNRRHGAAWGEVLCPDCAVVETPEDHALRDHEGDAEAYEWWRSQQ